MKHIKQMNVITATGWGICPIRSLDKKIFQKN